MSSYPAYIRRMLDQAREDGQWHAYQTDAAALCFDVLALFPTAPKPAAGPRDLSATSGWSRSTASLSSAISRNADDRPWRLCGGWRSPPCL